MKHGDLALASKYLIFDNQSQINLLLMISRFLLGLLLLAGHFEFRSELQSAFNRHSLGKLTLPPQSRNELRGGISVDT